VFVLEALRKVVDKLVVKVLTTQMGVTGGGLHLKDTLLDCQERYIEGPSSKIEDIVLTNNFLVKTVCDSSSSGLVDDMKNVHSGDGAGIGVLCSLSLGVVEVGKDGDDSVSDVVAQVGLSSLLHLKKDHQHIKNTIKVC